MKHPDENTARNEQVDFPEMQEGMTVLTADQQPLGKIVEIFRDLGQIESFGDKGLRPEQDGFQPGEYAYSEAMPGAGDNYLVARSSDGEILYIAFSHVDGVEDGKVHLSIDHDNVEDMNWRVRPDALKSLPDYDVDTGGESWVA